MREHLGGEAVARDVVEEAQGADGGLVGDGGVGSLRVALAGAGEDNVRGHSAQLRRHAGAQDRPILPLASLLVLCAEDDVVVGLDPAGEVDVVCEGVVDEGGCELVRRVDAD